MNMFRLATAVSAVALVCGMAAWAQDDSAATEFARGKTLLADGKFDEALAAFKAAAKANPDQGEYFQEFSMLQRVLNIREQLAKEESPETWEQMARALYGYYNSRKVYGEALTLAEAIHRRLNTGDSAALLASAQLRLNKNEAAAALLGGLPEAQRSATTDVLHGLALARLGKVDEAKACAEKLELPKDCGPDVCLNAARLYARVGRTEQGLAALRCAFECTPANQLPACREEAKGCPDLAPLRTDATFVQVLATESKVKGCGGCSSSKSCSAGKSTCGDKPAKEAGAQGGEKAPGGCEGHKH